MRPIGSVVCPCHPGRWFGRLPELGAEATLSARHRAWCLSACVAMIVVKAPGLLLEPRFRDATHDTLTFAQVLTDEVDGVFGMEGASAVTVSPDGLHVYATSAIDDSLVVFSRDATTDTLSFTDVVKQNGVGGVFGLEGAAAVRVSGDGRHVLPAARMPRRAGVVISGTGH